MSDKKMKTYKAEEGKVFKIGNHIFGKTLQVPEDFDVSGLEQIEIEDKK